MFQPRTYRHWTRGADLVGTVVVVRETDLYIGADSDLSQPAIDSVKKYRKDLEDYIAGDPRFLAALSPVDVPDSAPDIVKQMAVAAAKCGVGPMAAVAGAVAEFVGKDLLAYSNEIIVENGGDIFLKIDLARAVGIFAGKSRLSGRIALEIAPQQTPMGMCTSSGTVGHSLSYGAADAVVAVSKSTALADAAATAIGNAVKGPEQINDAIELARSIKGIDGVLIIVGEDMGVWGEMKLSDA